MYSIDHDWFGNPCRKASFDINRRAGYWVFEVEVKQAPIANLLAKPNEFFEGLWEQDVAEWFISSPATGRYLEINLAPNGAWWLMAFAAPRQRNERIMPELGQVRTSAEYDTNGWRAKFQLPHRQLQDTLGDSQLKYNVCFVLGQAPRTYLSWQKLSPQTPDFHCPHEFMAVLYE